MLVIIFPLKITQAHLLAAWEQVWGAGNTYLWIALLLVPLNLACEAQKYVLLVRKIFPLSWCRAMVGILAGMPLGLLTPNRVGEYVGRLWVLPREHRWSGGAFTFVNRSSQMFITLILGISAIEIFIWESRLEGPQWMFMLRWLAWGLGVIWLFVAGIGLWQVANPRWQHFPFIHRFIPALKRVGLSALAHILFWSALRNLTFVSQYILLLYACGFEGGIGTAFLMVWLVFLVKSLIPIASFAELGIRESVALTVMGLFGVGESISFSSTFVLYTLNILLPATLGLVFLTYLKAD